MAEILFSPEARKDLPETADYIVLHLRNKPAAQGLLKRIQKETMISGGSRRAVRP